MFFNFGRVFENVLLAAVGSMILKVACIRNLEQRPFWASNSTEKVLHLGYLLHLKICKIHWKSVYFLLMALLGCAFRVSCAAPSPLILLRPPFSTEFCSCFGKVLPALGGKHNFASCFDVRSTKKWPLALPFQRKSGILDPQTARGSLHDPLQEYQLPF